MQSSYMTFDFGQLHYQQAMSGKKQTILFLHGFNSSSASFSSLFELLKDRFNLVSLDFSGHGQSDPITDKKHLNYYTIQGLVEITTQFIRRLNLQNFYIAASSMGCHMAVCAMPELKTLQGLVLIGCIHGRTKEKTMSCSFPEIGTIFNPTPNTSEITAIASLSASSPEGIQQMMRDLKNNDGQFRKIYSSYYLEETNAWVDEIKLLEVSGLPHLHIQGVQDKLINSIYYKDQLIKEGMKASQIQLINDAGHMVHLDQSKACATLIKDFIAQTT